MRWACPRRASALAILINCVGVARSSLWFFHGLLILLGIHIYADQPRADKVCIISLESEHIKLTCIDNL